MKNNKKEIQEELDKLAPALSKLKKKEQYEVPENYFMGLPDEIIRRIDFSKNNVFTENNLVTPSNNWYEELKGWVSILFQSRVAIGVAMFLFLMTGMYFYYNVNTESNLLSNLSDAEMESYVKSNIEDFDEELIFNLVTDEGVKDLSGIEIGEDDLDEYLEEIIDDLEETDLEDFL